MSGYDCTRIVCALGTVVTGVFVATLTGNAAPLRYSSDEMREAQVSAIERRHFDVYSDYLQMQGVASIRPVAPGRGACLVSDTAREFAMALIVVPDALEFPQSISQLISQSRGD